MQPIQLVVFMEPVGKESDRSTQITGKDGKVKTIHYTPSPTRQNMSDVRQALLRQGRYFNRDVPLRLCLTFWLFRPKSVPKSRVFPTVKPDAKNMLALVEDAMNRFVYDDDCQNTTICLKKRYCKPGQLPRIEIYLAEDKE